MTMSDKGDKICPLCTEEMDLTDQQLKPCKCGYEICIWCWHHIMGMAEKDATEGRCPACRTPYDKERIVGMASNRSVVTEIKVERKHKVQKAKPKASELRKHLGSVRVFQRNLVHVIGLPLGIADEELLKRREYFGQYGKIMKTCISRTASGIIQHSSNDCFSLYITYSKEEEAVRCIQSVHSFMLEGRCLRACFGTTKYCNSWLKNVPCSNQHCLYLHDYGSEQDSFSKDEMASAFARVQQTIGATHNMQLRSGNVLPPPADEYSNVTPTVAKPVDKVMLKGIDKQKISLADANTGKYVGPAPASSCVNHVPTWPLVSNSSGLTGPGKQKSNSSRDAMVIPSPVLSAKKLEPDVVIDRSKKNEVTLEGHSDCKPNLSDSTLHSVGRNHHTPSLNIKTEVISTASPPISSPSNLSPSHSPSKQGGESIATSSTCTIPVEFTRERSSVGRDKVDNTNIVGEFQSLGSELSSISVHSSSLEDESSIPDVPVRVSFSVGATTTVNADSDLKKDYSLALDGQVPKGSEGISPLVSSLHELNESSNQSTWDSWKFDGVYIGNNINSVPQKMPFKPEFAAFPFASGNPLLDNNKGLDNSQYSLNEMDKMPECSDLFPDVRNGTPLGRYGSDIANSNNTGASDIDESHIISNILSMDGWEDGLTSSDNFAKLFAEADRQHGSQILRNAGKLQNANQSRFLFAQQEDLPIQAPDLEHRFGQALNHCFPRQDSVKNNNPPVENCQSTVSYNSFAGYDNARGQCFTSSNKLSVCKPKVLTPPGFSASSKAPPPGFFSHERMDLAAGKFSGGHGHFAASGNIASPVDAELNDPAILEIGKGLPTAGLDQTGLWHNSYTPPSPSDYEARLELLMQKPVDQNPKLADYFSNRFSVQNNLYSAPTFQDYSQCGNLSPFAPLTNQNLRNDQPNGYWGGLNPVNSINNPAISDFLSNENYGGNKLIPGYEDTMFRVPGTGNLYNRGFGF